MRAFIKKIIKILQENKFRTQRSSKNLNYNVSTVKVNERIKQEDIYW